MNNQQALQAKIITILGSVFAAVSSWKPTTNLGNIVSDVSNVVTTVQAIDPNVIPSTIEQNIEQVPAEFAAVSSGQLAIVGSVPASFDGVHDEILIFGVRKYLNGTAPTDSPAAVLKTMNGY